MLRLSVAVLLVLLLLAGCTKPAPHPASGHSDTTVTIPSASARGAEAKQLPPASPPDTDPLSLEPRDRASPGAGACGGACRGKLGAALEKDLTERARKTRACYNRALALDPALQGRLVIEMRIGKDGAVCAATLVKSDLLTSNVSECVLSDLMSHAYSAPEGEDCVVVNVPITFLRERDAGATP